MAPALLPVRAERTTRSAAGRVSPSGMIRHFATGCWPISRRTGRSTSSIGRMWCLDRAFWWQKSAGSCTSGTRWPIMHSPHWPMAQRQAPSAHLMRCPLVTTAEPTRKERRLVSGTQSKRCVPDSSVWTLPEHLQNTRRKNAGGADASPQLQRWMADTIRPYCRRECTGNRRRESDASVGAQKEAVHRHGAPEPVGHPVLTQTQRADSLVQRGKSGGLADFTGSLDLVGLSECSGAM